MKPPEQVGSAARLTAFIVLCVLTWLLGMLAWSTLILAFVESLVLIAAASYLLSRYVVRRLSCRRRVPSVAVEGQRIAVELTLTNPSVLPAFLIEIKDELTPDPTPTKQLLLPGLSRGAEHAPLRYHGVCGRGRGVYRLESLELAVSDPMGLFRIRRRVETVDTIVVQPGSVDLPLADLPARRMSFEIGGGNAPRAGQSISPLGIRECGEAVPLRHIHWRASARRGQLVVKEYETGTGIDLALFLDLHRATAGEGTHSGVEQAIRIAATLGRHAAREGYRLQLVADDGEPVVLPPRSGPRQLPPLLDLLARVQSTGETAYFDLLERGYGLLGRGATLGLIFNNPDIDVPRLQALCGMWRRRDVVARAWVVAGDQDATAATLAALDRMGIVSAAVETV